MRSPGRTRSKHAGRGRVAWYGGLVLLSLALAASAGENVRVTTTDGRVIVGELHTPRMSETLLIRAGACDVYLSSRIVKTVDRADVVESPVYVLAKNVALVRSTPKKGTINPVVKDVAWGPMALDGHTNISLLDPKLGKVSFKMVITRITPQTYEWQGVEYSQTLGFPLSRVPNRFWKQMVFREVNFKDAQSLVKAIGFFMQSGDAVAAREILVALEKVSPQAAAEHRPAVAADAVEKTLQQAERLESLGLHRKAGLLIERLATSDDGQLVDVNLGGRLKAEAAKFAEISRAFADAEKLLADVGLGDIKPSLAEARRVIKAAAMGVEGRQTLTRQDMLTTLAPWSGPLLELEKLTPEILTDARTLAEATAAYFAAERPGDTRALASRFTASPLPMALKLAIFSEAKAPPTEAAQSGEPITYSHPKTREKFHYYLTLPPDYDPRRATPAVICMHGQVTKAGVMKTFWGRTAAANGLILIDPEYIYGRTQGYHFSEQEHRAVLGALWHAAGSVNIDMDRVYLHGHSQGGHACWDMGAAHAGRFAGVLPVIGAPFLNNPLPNYTDTALYSIDGSLDGQAPGMNQGAVRLLGSLGADATYVEYIGRGHEAFVEEHDRVSLWMLRHRRDPAPRRLHLVALRDCDLRRRWIEVEGTYKRLQPMTGGLQVRPEPTAAIVQASVDDNTFTIRTGNVSRLRILLSPRLIDFAQKVTVQLNGRNARPQAAKPDWAFALADSFARRDRRDIYLGQIRLYVQSR